MKKNNSADFTQFELFDENMNVFEIVAESEKEKKKRDTINMEYVERLYMTKFPAKFRRYIQNWWNVPECQYYIKKALDYNLSNKDNDIIFDLGSKDQKTGKLGKRENAKYPFLYYVCCIHIHPLTKAAAITKRVFRLSESLKY